MDALLSKRTRRMGAALLACVFALVGIRSAAAEGFRIENRVFLEDEEQPRISSTTIFYDDLVYDFLDSPKEITVYDRAANRIVLLDPVRKTRTEVSVQNLETTSERLRKWAAGQSDDLLRFSAAPDFAESYDSSTGKLQMSSVWLTYDVVTVEPNRSEMLTRYYDFCNCYCLLNAFLSPGTRPPFARIDLNRALEEKGRLPSEVHLAISPKGDSFLAEKITARSIHRVVPHLLESDRTRVAQTDEYIAIFRPVPFKEYQEMVQPNRQ